MSWYPSSRLLIPLSLLLGAAPLRAQSALDSVDRYLRAELVRQRIPGMSVAVLRGDSVLLARGYGFANLEHRVPATDSTVYQSGSIGKQFTAAAIVTLAREGRLGLDDPIRRYLPEGPPAWRRVTIRHLLTHTSGISDYTDRTVDYRRDYTEQQLVALAARLPLQFRPGATWSYSNTGYALLGFIVRRVTGKFYGDYLRERVFDPLGMRTARIISESDIVPNRAAGYRLEKGELKHQEWVSPTLNTTADGSLYLTVLDLARWAIGLNHARVPDSAGLRESWTPVRLEDGGTYPYGFGWTVADQRGRLRIGHTGAWQGFQTSIQRYPDFDLTVIVLANLDAALPEALSFGIAGILEPALLPPHLATPDEEGPPEPVAVLLAAVAAGSASPRLAPGLRAFASKSVRQEWGRTLADVSRWEPLGPRGPSRDCSPRWPTPPIGARPRWTHTRIEVRRSGGGSSSRFPSFNPRWEMIVLETIHHVSITVSDLERSKRFYAGVLGLQEIERPGFDFPGAWYRVGDRQLHLIVHPDTRTHRGTTAIDSRDGHFALRVRSHRETRAHLEAAGVHFEDRPHNRTPWPQIYVTDPDGNVIELNAERLD